MKYKIGQLVKIITDKYPQYEDLFAKIIKPTEYTKNGFINVDIPHNREGGLNLKVSDVRLATEEEAEDWLRNRTKDNFTILDTIKPNYYKSKSGQDVLDVIDDFGLDFYMGNLLKYVVRSGKKPNESALKDLLKAKEYLERKIASLTSK